MISFLGLIVANIVTAPTLISVLILILLISFKLKIINKEHLLTFYAYLGIFIILLVVFYGLFGNPERSGVVGVEISSPLTLLKELFSVQKIRTQINFIAESIIYLLILYFPLIFFLFKRRSLITIRNLPLMFVVILVFVSILLWAIFYYELNSYQIFSNISTPAINVSAIILIISSIDNGVLSCRTRSFYGWGINALVVLTLGVNIINFLKKIEDIKTQKHSYIYLKKIYESIPENELVASLRSSVDMQSMHKKK